MERANEPWVTYLNQQHSLPFYVQGYSNWVSVTMAKRAQANKSPHRHNAFEKLKIPGISKSSGNVGCFPCYFSYYCCQVFIPKLEFLDENQDLEKEEITMVQFPYTRYNQRTEGKVLRSLSIKNQGTPKVSFACFPANISTPLPIGLTVSREEPEPIIKKHPLNSHSVQL